MSLVFVHGWGFDSSLWESVREELRDLECETLDLGFYGRPAAARPNGRTVAIGHSLGFLWLLHERPFPWRALVSISGMPRFTKAADYRCGVAARLLDSMIARFAGAPQATLDDFFARCGTTAAAPDGADCRRLAEALLWLKDWDARDSLAAERVPLLALYAADDEIVPKELSEDVFASRPETVLGASPGGGHALPLSRPKWVASHIREFVGRLA
jgi:pimeloyl-[acyl-carrier protein] methyl ester esterase